MWAVREPWGNFVDISKVTLCFYSHSSGHSTFYPSFESLYLCLLLDYGEAEGRGSTDFLLAVPGKVPLPARCLMCPAQHQLPLANVPVWMRYLEFGKPEEGWKVCVQLTVLTLCTSLECRECFCFHLPYENAGPKETWGCLPPWDGELNHDRLRSNFKSWLILRATHSQTKR